MRSWASGLRRGGSINFNTILAAACVGFSIFMFVVIPGQVERPPVLLGQSEGLDPAFFPELVAIGFLIAGLAYLWTSVGLRDGNGFNGLTRANYASTGFTTLAFIAYAALLEPLGFVLSSALVVAVLSAFYGARHWISIAAVAVGVPAIVYVLFRRVLAVALPEMPDF